MENIRIGLLRKFLTYSILLFSMSKSFGQVTKIKLEKNTHKFSFRPDTNILYKWQQENMIKVWSLPDTGIIYKVKGINMNVEEMGEGNYKLTPDHSDTLTYDAGKLLIYRLNGDGDKSLHTVKEYKFIEPELPRVKVHDVWSDSIIQKQDFINSKLEAYHKGKRVLILSYGAVRSINDTTDLRLNIKGCEFPIGIKNDFHKLRDASVVYFYDVKIMLLNGYIETIPEIQFFVEDKNKSVLKKTN